MVPFYHPRVFERVNIALLDLFDRVDINRYNKDGSVRKKIRVPVTFHYSKNFADFILNTQDNPESKHTYPILGLRMGALERNPGGTTSRTFIREIYDSASKQMIQDSRPCPWIQTYTLTSYTELIHDHFQMMEQIIPYFNPMFNTAIKEFEFSNLKRDVIVELVSVAPQYNDEVDREKARSYVCEYTFRVKFEMYAPFYLGTLIKEVNNRIAASGKEIEQIKNLEVMDVTLEEYDRKMNEVVSAGKLLDSVVVSTIEANPDSEVTKAVEFDSSGRIEIATVPKGKRIWKCSVAIIDPFNSTSARIAVGVDANKGMVMESKDSNLSLAARYMVELNGQPLQEDTTIYAYYEKGTASRGSLDVTLQWT